MKKSSSGRTGRRAGASTTRDEILAAARVRFGERGYAATSMRQIAADAGVDAALVHYFFGSKDDLFAAVMDLPFSPSEVFTGPLEQGLDGAGERIIRRYLEVWESAEMQAGMMTMVRSAAADPAGGAVLRGFLEAELRPRIAAAIDKPDGELRATLAGAALIGVAFERYILKLEPIASADPETIVSWVGPTINRYLTA